MNFTMLNVKPTKGKLLDHQLVRLARVYLDSQALLPMFHAATPCYWTRQPRTQRETWYWEPSYRERRFPGPNDSFLACQGCFRVDDYPIRTCPMFVVRFHRS
jgi:hypothetical protein